MTREEAIKILNAIRVYECYPKSASEETKKAIDMAIEALQTELNKAVPQSLADVYKWERDIALAQLEEYGIGFAEKKRDDLLEIVRCKDCRKQGSDDCPMFIREWRTVMRGSECVDDFIFHDLTKPNGFCNYGERREP
jgi:hypothetical protein